MLTQAGQRLPIVFGAIILVGALVATAPLVTLYDGPPVQGLIMAAAAVALAIVAIAMPPREATHCSRLLRSVAWALAIPAIWIAIQLMLLPLGISNPIWQSAGPALGKPLLGSVTVDFGKTVFSLAQYLTMVALLVATSAVTINRERAEYVLQCLTAVTTAMALMLIVCHVASIASYSVMVILQGGSALGVAITTASGLRAFEKFETRTGKHELSPRQFSLAVIVGLAPLVICWGAVIGFAPTQVIFATGCGFAVLILVAVGRRLGTARWFITAFVGLAIPLVIAFAAISSSGHGDLTIRYSTAPPSEVTTAERLRNDTGWLGTGAGTYAALVPIYQDAEVGTTSPPTTVAGITIELGSAIQWILLLLVLLGAGFYFQGALGRGRDWYYPCLAASAAVILLIEAFIDVSGLQTSIALIASIIAGLGLAQVVSRTAT